MSESKMFHLLKSFWANRVLRLFPQSLLSASSRFVMKVCALPRCYRADTQGARFDARAGGCQYLYDFDKAVENAIEWKTPRPDRAVTAIARVMMEKSGIV
jgi:hypothetical protein